MKNARRAQALCIVGNLETGRGLQTAIDKCDVLSAVISDHDSDVFEKMEEHKPVVIVIEDDPGKLDGVKLVQKIRRSAECPNIEIPILLILSRATTGRAIYGSESGANHMLTSPFTADKLWESFEQALNDTRKFVNTEEYVGPERRGMSNKKRGNSSSQFSGKRRRRKDR